MAERDAVLYEFLIHQPGNPFFPTGLPGPLDPYKFAHLEPEFMLGAKSVPGPKGPGFQTEHFAAMGNHSDWFLNNLWIKPRPVDYGNIISDRTITLTIFNTWLRPRYLIDIDTATLNAVGVEITSDTDLPLEIDFFQEVSIDFTAAALGVIAFDEPIDFEFDDDAIIPVLTSISPTSADVGDAPFTLTLNGQNFNETSKAHWNGTPRPTVVVSDTQLQISVTADDLENGGIIGITVRNSPILLPPSESVNLTINNPVPVVTTLTPDTVDEFDPDTVITVEGTDFVPSSIGRVAGANRATVFIDSTELQVTALAADLIPDGTRDIDVVNPAPGGGTSNAATLTIDNVPLPLTRTNLLGQRTNTSASSAFTPPNNSLLVVVQCVNQQSGAIDPSPNLTLANSAGLTFTPRLNIGSSASWSRGIRIWTAPVSTGVSMTVTGGLSTGTVNTIDTFVFAYTGYDVASPIGATASANNVADGANRTITLSGAPATDSDVIAAVINNYTGANAITHGTGWTEHYELTGGNITSQTQTRTGSADTSVLWDNLPATFQGNSVAAALEIKKAP